MRAAIRPEVAPLGAALGRHIRAARLARGDSQQLLAQRAGVSVPTLARLEGGDLGVAVGGVLSVLAALGLARQWVAAVAPALEALAPAPLARRAGRKPRPRDWGEDLF